MPPDPDEKKIILCPNCQQMATKAGNEITCERCDAVFVVTKKQGAKLKQIGAIEDLTERVAKLESLIPDDEPQPEEAPADPETDPESEEEDIL